MRCPQLQVPRDLGYRRYRSVTAGGRAMHKRRRSGVVLPAVYLGVACIVAVTIMPSVLRPPPDQQQSSGALNPNAPPDDQPDTILQSLQQAASHTAGASG